MTSPFFFLVLGLVLLFAGGEWLVRGSAALALRLGLKPLVVGLTVVAFGTSAPELVVSIKAALADRGAIAIGNVVGSNSLNIGLILGLTALIFPLKVQLQILRIDQPIMLGVTVLAVAFLADLHVGRIEGGILLAGLLAYVTFTVISALRTVPSAEVSAEFAEAMPPIRGNIWRDLALIAAGLVALIYGSRYLVLGAVDLARGFGISEAVIGLTIVALGTSTPELVACLVAAIKKEPDIALGNIIGSNIFNILGILGASALVRPLDGAGIQRVDLWVMLAFAAVLLPILFTGRRMSRGEGALLLAGYAGYIAFQIASIAKP
jgi:cation:H+ antiporter